MQNSYRQFLLSPLFVLGLFLLLLNDFFLKAHFGNFLTGKLSDFAGLFIFPLFFVAFFPRRKLAIYFATALLFTFWKSPFSQYFIDLINYFLFFKIGRTIDYSDLFALSVLPISYYYFKVKDCKPKIISFDFAKRILASFVVLLSVFAFTATSYEEDRSIFFDKRYVFKGSKEEFDTKIKQLNSISKIEIESQKDAFKNAPIAETLANNLYFYNFKINKKFCDSNDIKIFSSVEVNENSLYFDIPSARYWCKQKPTTETETEVLEIFEQEFIAHSGLILVGSFSETKKNK